MTPCNFAHCAPRTRPVSLTTNLPYWIDAALTVLAQVGASLPPKRIFGKMTDAVIKMRQDGLEQYLHAVLRELESEQVRMIYAFLQLPPSLQGGLAAGQDVALQHAPSGLYPCTTL